ncbi:MAG: family 10 glycosylhydrolase [Lachnospiraceae bacterium]|nr:family 10 glycosylhydrolase [Lachnospiraceae bacterium]
MKLNFLKIVKKAAAGLLIGALALTQLPANEVRAATAASGLKGVWISFLDYEAYLKGKNKEAFDASFDAMCQQSVNQGCNALFVHVRSHNDAVYPSNIYPWSTTMLNGNPGFDPLSDMVSIAHGKGLTFHAWINPYGYRNGAISGNPALATTDNVVAGVQEIADNYAVDGIHFDDYFPPIGTAAINAMVTRVHQTCESKGKIFGISPQGNIDNCIRMGADVRTWLSTPGYVDYICPQIYWSDNYSSTGTVQMYTQRLMAWKKMDTAGIPLYVGLAAYKAGQAIGSDPGWRLSSANLATQVDKARAQGYTGYIIYRYETLHSPVAAAELQGLKAKG